MPISQENPEILSKFYEFSDLNNLKSPRNTLNLSKIYKNFDGASMYRNNNNHRIEDLRERYLNNPQNNLLRLKGNDTDLYPDIDSKLFLKPKPPTQAPTPADTAKAFEDALAKALSPDDLGTVVEKLKLTEIPRDGETYSDRFKKGFHKLTDIDLGNIIRDLEETIRSLPSVPPHIQSALASHLEEARRRGIDVYKLEDLEEVKKPVDAPLETTAITVSQLFSPKTPDAPTRPVTGLEHETTEMLVRKRENLEKSGLPKDIIDHLRKTIDQELTYRESNTENSAA